MKNLWSWTMLLLLVVIGCGDIDQPIEELLPEVGVDPVVSWTTVTTNCVGEAMVGVTYNAYSISGSGPMPYISTPNDPPCGSIHLVDTSLVIKNNTVAITVPTFNFILGPGTWTIAIEAVASDGTKGGFAAISFNVVNRPGLPSDVHLGVVCESTEESVCMP